MSAYNRDKTHNAEKYLNLLLENSPNIIFLLDQYGNLSHCSNAFLTIAGIDRFEDVYGMNVSDVYRIFENEEFTKQEVNRFEQIKIDRQPSETTVDIKPPAIGERRQFTIYYTPMLDNDGGFDGVLVIYLDITATRRSEAAQAASKAKSRFLASMSHEIRTPMNTIIGISELIRTDNLDEVQLGRLSDIRKTSRSLLEIIDDILEFSKIEAGKLGLIPINYNLISLYDNVCFHTRFSIGDKPLDFRHYFDPDLPSVLYGDESRLRQIIVNLTSNAVKYTAKGYINLDLSRLKKSDGDYLCIRVEDTGIGIKEEDYPRLFEAFYQTQSSKNRGIVGVGLGLSITKHLVDLMHGDIEFRSVSGFGSVFIVQIPLMEGNTEDTEKTKDLKRVLLATGTKILIVDDNELNLAVAQGFILRHGITPDTTMSGIDAIKKIKADRYDLVFMDHLMPDLDGTEVTGIIRSFDEEYFKNLPIIALTANVVPEARESFMNAGMNDFIAKPLEAHELNSMLKKWLPEKKLIGSAGDEWLRDLPQISDDLLKNLTNSHGLNVSAGISRVGSAEVYLMVLKQFFMQIDKYVHEISEAFTAGAWKSYQTYMHSIKTVLANIGDSFLSGWASTLEKASVQGDIITCYEQTALFCSELQNLRSRLQLTSLTDESYEPEKEPIVEKDLLAILDNLEHNCTIGFVEETERIAEELILAAFNKEIDAIVAEIYQLVQSFDYDKVLELTPQIRILLQESL